jgi:mono/diheme cytochrome c family protein
VKRVAFGLPEGTKTTSARPPSPAPIDAAPITYNAARAERGAVVYRGNCSACHMGDLSGGDKGPTLKGKEFWSGWNQTKARSLYSRIISTMPEYDPGSLSSDEVLDVMAYILQVNDVASSDKGFQRADDLNNVKLVQSH